VRADRCRRQAAPFAPGEEFSARSGIGPPRVRVADLGSEEFDIAPAGLVAEIGDQCGHDIWCLRVGRDLGLLDGRRKMSVGRFQGGPLPRNIAHDKGRYHAQMHSYLGLQSDGVSGRGLGGQMVDRSICHPLVDYTECRTRLSY
jgi:hypothetical protein